MHLGPFTRGRKSLLAGKSQPRRTPAAASALVAALLAGCGLTWGPYWSPGSLSENLTRGAWRIEYLPQLYGQELPYDGPLQRCTLRFLAGGSDGSSTGRGGPFEITGAAEARGSWEVLGGHWPFLRLNVPGVFEAVLGGDWLLDDEYQDDADRIALRRRPDSSAEARLILVRELTEALPQPPPRRGTVGPGGPRP